MAYSSVLPAQAQERLAQLGDECILLDVRTAGEFESVHASAAVHHPLQDLNAQSLERYRGKKIFCICQSGMRGKQAATLFADAGFSDVFNVEGGTNAWASAGLPVVRGRQQMSMERQVRLTAGALVAVGVIFGALFSSAFYFLALFVGLGLVFSAITDTCGMASVLAQMPWHKR